MSFDEFLKNIVAQEALISATLSSPKSNQNKFKKVLIKKVSGAKKPYQLSFEGQNKVFHENFLATDLSSWIKNALESEYSQGFFTAPGMDFHLLSNKKGQVTVVKKVSKRKTLEVLPHNRQKNHLLQEGEPIDFLVHLGVMLPNGKVVSSKYAKFRQINRFLELINDLLPQTPSERALKVIDFGCGKAYLTFALYHYLRNIKGVDVEILGLDLKDDVIAYCQQVADELGYKSLRFERGDIASCNYDGQVDLVVALHACDTATDAAITKALLWKAKAIAVVPCCQHELFKQIKAPLLQPLLKHGLLKERFSALVTDAARAEFLELSGYKTDIVEFVDFEHTPKNLMIRARRQSGAVKVDDSRYKAFKQFLSIELSGYDAKTQR